MARDPKSRYYQFPVSEQTQGILRKELKIINSSTSRFVQMLIQNYFFKKYGIDIMTPENTDWEQVRQKHGLETMLMMQEIISKFKPNKISIGEHVVVPKDFKK